MMLTEPYYYRGNNPAEEAAGRVASEVAADELVLPLESALRSLRADPANVSRSIAELVRRTLASLTRIRIEERLAKVGGHVAREFRLPLEELQSRSREQRITFARQLAMFMAREITSAPFGLIGQHFNRDHSTAVHAHRLIERRPRTTSPIAPAVFGDNGAVHFRLRNQFFVIDSLFNKAELVSGNDKVTISRVSQ